MVYASIVIPTYNEEKDISECLKSLKKQSYKDFEVIIVDDGSSDKTLEVIKKVPKKEKLNVKVLKQEHLGPGRARNLGSNIAKGKILIFIDADMTFGKDYLKNLIKPILNDWGAIGTTHDCEVATNIDNKWSILWGEKRVSKENAKDVKIFRAIRKNKFLEMGRFDPKYSYADDQTFWFKYGIKPIVAKNTICYHRNPESLKGTYKQARWIGSSWKERYKIFKFPVIGHILVLITFLFYPAAIIIKSVKSFKVGFSFKDSIKFYAVKFLGYLSGIFRAVFYNNILK